MFLRRPETNTRKEKVLGLQELQGGNYGDLEGVCLCPSYICSFEPYNIYMIHKHYLVSSYIEAVRALKTKLQCSQPDFDKSVEWIQTLLLTYDLGLALCNIDILCIKFVMLNVVCFTVVAECT